MVANATVDYTALSLVKNRTSPFCKYSSYNISFKLKNKHAKPIGTKLRTHTKYTPSCLNGIKVRANGGKGTVVV